MDISDQHNYRIIQNVTSVFQDQECLSGLAKKSIQGALRQSHHSKGVRELTTTTTTKCEDKARLENKMRAVNQSQDNSDELVDR